MVGDITAPRVIIVDGASFRGRIDMGEVDVEGAQETRSTRSMPAPSSRPALRPPSRLSAPPPPKAEARNESTVAAKPLAPPAPVAMGAVKRKVIVKRK